MGQRGVDFPPLFVQQPLFVQEPKRGFHDMSRAPKAVLTAGVAMALAVAGLATTADASSKSSSAAKPHSSARHHDSTPDKSFTPANRKAALAVAKSREPAISKAFGFSKAQQLHVKDVERDADGTLHLRYTRTLGGLKVFGGDFVVHVAPSGKVRGADFASSNPLALRAHAPTHVSAAKAAHITARLVHAGDAKVSPAKRVVWAVDGMPRLAWYSRVVGHDKFGNPIPRAVVVDARTGKRIQSWDLYETAKGTGHSQYVGTVKINTVRTGKPGHIHYVLRDTSRGGNFAVDVHNKSDVNGDGTPPFRNGPIFSDKNNIWGNGKPANRQTAAVDVAYGVAKTWDYYKKTFHRNGIAGNGKGVKSRVHYGNHYDNAFWADGCFCMTYGDGSGQPAASGAVTGLDVAGHEMSHGVTSRTAGLYYFGDQGGLNEANSDIFGTMVEFFAHNTKDKGDYYIGDKIVRRRQRSCAGWTTRASTAPASTAGTSTWASPTRTTALVRATTSSTCWQRDPGRRRSAGCQHNSPDLRRRCRGQGIGRDQGGSDLVPRADSVLHVDRELLDARDATIHVGDRPVRQEQPEPARRSRRPGTPSPCRSSTGPAPARRSSEGANALTSPGFENRTPRGLPPVRAS